MEKVSSGILGLDEMLDGGFPRGRIILLCGGPGTGKTVFSLQFLAKAAERGEAGVYVTLEEPLELIRKNAETFGWALDEKERKNLLRMLDFYAVPYAGTIGIRERQSKKFILSIMNEIEMAVYDIDAKNVVIDPLTSLTIHEHSAGIKRHKIASLFDRLRKLRCTSICTSEVQSPTREFYIEEFLADGVIWFEKVIKDFTLIKTVRIEKMRGVAYDEQPRRYTINENGLTVYSTEPISWMERK
ncbi:TPA: hypothetical protein EYP70_06890 [Candidatus Bathyarchaeota archaeon]|nr:hypothetical protein [Candidatus Bathyarchaeota archaeon]